MSKIKTYSEEFVDEVAENQHDHDGPGDSWRFSLYARINVQN